MKSPVVRDWPGSLPSITSPRTRLRNDAVDAVILIGRFFAGTRNDQRRARFVNENGINFVDDGEIEIALDIIFQTEFHVVAQIVETELVVSAVSDIGAVGFAALLFVEIVNDVAHGQAEEAMDAAHPFRIAARQVIVYRYDVNALAFERIQDN